MPWDVTKFCEGLADAFLRGDLDAVVRHYAVPLAVYREDGILLQSTREEISSTLSDRRAAALAAGMSDLEVTVIDVQPLAGGRVAILYEWRFRDGTGREIGDYRARHYCRRRPRGSLEIEMVEVVKSAGLPQPR